MKHTTIRQQLLQAAAETSATGQLPLEPMGVDGSGYPQCTLTGLPGQYGHRSAAALSHTVITIRIWGASAFENSFQLLL